MRDVLAQDEREAQNEVDRELELGQMKLRDLTKKLSENYDSMGKTSEDINSLLSQSRTSAFLQVRPSLSGKGEAGETGRLENLNLIK